MPLAPTKDRVYIPQRIDVIPAGQSAPVVTVNQGTINYNPTPAGSIVPVRPSAPITLPPKQAGQFQQQYTPTSPTGGFIRSQWKQRQPATPGGRQRDPGAQFVGDVAGQPFVAGVIDQLKNTPLNSSNAYAWYSTDPTNASQLSYQVGRNLTQQLMGVPQAATNWVGDKLTTAWDFYRNAWQNLPNFNLRNFKLPQFQLPNFQLPKITLPSLPQPRPQPDNLTDPDPSPGSQSDRDYQDYQENEKNRRNQRDFDSKSTSDQIDDIAKNLDPNCIAYVKLAVSRIDTYDFMYSFYSIASGRDLLVHPEHPRSSERVPGAAGQIDTSYDISSLIDGHGNVSPMYVGEEGSGTIQEYGWDYSVGGSGAQRMDTAADLAEIAATRQLITTYWAFAIIRNNTKASDLFKLSPDADPVLDINEYTFVGGTIVCTVPPIARQPTFYPVDPLPNPIPPNPPDNQGKDPMSCSCADIAAIMKKTLQECKFSAEIPVVSCKYFDDTKEWAVEISYVNMEIFAVDQKTAESQAALYLQLAQQAMDLCEAKNYVYATATAVGVDDYPVTTPKSLISDDSAQDKEQIEITSLTQLFSWYVGRFDEIVGQFEIPIKIKDTDLIQAGDQPKTIKLPNIAEAIAEMFMLAFQANINTETLINMCTRILFEGGQDKQQNFITYKLLYSLVDWAGYKTKDVNDEMPLLFTPDKTNLSDILKESKVKVGTQVLDEKFGLEIDLMRFRKAAGIIDAVHFRKVNPFADIAPQIMAYLLGAKGTSDKINEEEVEEKWEQFIEEAQVGFRDTVGISNPDLPYGKPFEQRPRIRDLSQVDPNNP